MTDPKQPPDLVAVIATLRTREEAHAFLTDLCTPAELEAMEGRWQVAKLLQTGLPTGRSTNGPG